MGRSWSEVDDAQTHLVKKKNYSLKIKIITQKTASTHHTPSTGGGEKYKESTEKNKNNTKGPEPAKITISHCRFFFKFSSFGHNLHSILQGGSVVYECVDHFVGWFHMFLVLCVCVFHPKPKIKLWGLGVWSVLYLGLKIKNLWRVGYTFAQSGQLILFFLGDLLLDVLGVASCC